MWHVVMWCVVCGVWYVMWCMVYVVCVFVVGRLVSCVSHASNPDTFNRYIKTSEQKGNKTENN